MLRVEIVANQSVEENIQEALKDHNAGKYYTLFPNVYGSGTCGPRMGDSIWPEMNFVMVIWCEKDEALRISQAVADVKEKYPDEGIKVFGIPSEEE